MQIPLGISINNRELVGETAQISIGTRLGCDTHPAMYFFAVYIEDSPSTIATVTDDLHTDFA
jgi:hypothetical protein